MFNRQLQLMFHNW